MMTMMISFRISALFLLAMVLLPCCEAFQIAAPTAAAWAWYKSMLVSQPLLTKSITSSCIMSLSDVMCQELVAARTASEAKKGTTTKSSLQAVDFTRVVQVAITGFFWSGPVTHYWYSLLERIFVSLSQLLHIQNAGIGLIVKLFLDAILFSPMVVAGYFCVRSILEGSGVAGAMEKLQTKFKQTLIGAWKFWPLVNSINFWFVPLQFRVLYMNVLSLFWSGYLTYVNSAKGPSQPKSKRS